jgi:hypothetical protein
MPNLDPDGYYDTPFWGKVKDPESGDDKRAMAMPITRYDNIVGRPKAIDDMDDASMAPILLLKTKESTISDQTIFNLVGQIW